MEDHVNLKKHLSQDFFPMLELTAIQKIAIFALPVLFAISFHEVAHGWVASLFGDQTARYSGRLSLNPLRHIDLIGTIIVPLVMVMISSIIFGWAKPVPVDPRNLRNPRRDMAIVALAGPFSNLLMAFIWGGITRVGKLLVDYLDNDWFGIPLIYIGSAGVMVNVVFAVLNLIPLPPLDGGKILGALLPPRLSYHLSVIEPYSFLILILLIFSGVLSKVIGPPILFLIQLITAIT